MSENAFRLCDTLQTADSAYQLGKAAAELRFQHHGLELQQTVQVLERHAGRVAEILRVRVNAHAGNEDLTAGSFEESVPRLKRDLRADGVHAAVPLNLDELALLRSLMNSVLSVPP